MKRPQAQTLLPWYKHLHVLVRDLGHGSITPSLHICRVKQIPSVDRLSKDAVCQRQSTEQV